MRRMQQGSLHVGVTALFWLSQVQATLHCRDTLISYQLVDEWGTGSDGKSHFICMEWIQMHRKC